MNKSKLFGLIVLITIMVFSFVSCDGSDDDKLGGGGSGGGLGGGGSSGGTGGGSSGESSGGASGGNGGSVDLGSEDYSSIILTGGPAGSVGTVAVPTGFVGEFISADAVKLTWDIRRHPEAPAKGTIGTEYLDNGAVNQGNISYQVHISYYYTKGLSAKTIKRPIGNMTINKDGTTHSAIIQDLEANTSYIFYLTRKELIYNSSTSTITSPEKESFYSLPVFIRTPSTGAGLNPVLTVSSSVLNAPGTGAKSCILSWTASPGAAYYMIMGGETTTLYSEQTKVYSGTTFNYLSGTHGIYSNNRRYFFVVAYYADGRTYTSNIVDATPSAGGSGGNSGDGNNGGGNSGGGQSLAPWPPSGISVSAYGSGSLMVRWAIGQGPDAESYDVYYSTSAGGPWYFNGTTYPGYNYSLITGLNPSTIYWVKIIARNKAGSNYGLGSGRTSM